MSAIPTGTASVQFNSRNGKLGLELSDATSSSYALSVRVRIPIPSTATSYSVRRATIGSMADARRAGRYPANKATRRRSMETNAVVGRSLGERDRKSTRLNSSHGYISYAVFCLKQK